MKQEGQPAGVGPNFHLPGQPILGSRFFEPQPHFVGSPRRKAASIRMASPKTIGVRRCSLNPSLGDDAHRFGRHTCRSKSGALMNTRKEKNWAQSCTPKVRPSYSPCQKHTNATLSKTCADCLADELCEAFRMSFLGLLAQSWLTRKCHGARVLPTRMTRMTCGRGSCEGVKLTRPTRRN